ncbi:MAG: PSD1 and planctomycete cytochrome C domain-containing protein [Verrucomicrobiaceae bacterium]|nr:PSD1 and planctomycete cytochrome C domain-containing protein [Verrucomicrobiaceae bacterium]
MKFVLSSLTLIPTFAVLAEVSYNQDVRPILAENCFYCHGQDPNKRKADLRLDVREAAVEFGAFVPGKPEESELVARLFSHEADELMPPAKSNRKLTEEQKALLKQWIAEGANYEKHWTFTAPVKAPLPEVKQTGWVRNEIDRFVLAKLEAKKLQPSPEADKTTLIRRLSLDLIGLPPSPAEVDAFESDKAPDAYDKLVERLLKSEHYGERLALPWLDAARYADSNGFQQDGDTFQWVWRDWVVKALNADMPYSQFSIEQLAGDLLPNASQEQMIATAFNRNHLLNGEGGAIPEEQRFNILFDRVDTTSTTWLGLTMACAQCHDHKYDPMTQRDYYSLMSIFNQVSEDGRAGGGGGAKRVAAPFLEMLTEENKRQMAEIEAKRAKVEAEGQVKIKKDLAFAAWEAAVTPETKAGRLDRPLRPNITTLLRIPAEKRTEEQKRELQKSLRAAFESDVWPKIAAADAPSKQVEDLKTQLTTFKNERIPRIMIMRDDKPRDTFVLDRGEYLKPKEKVSGTTPAFLPPATKGSPQNRLGFAQWLFQPDHPLTARVQVNRMWQTLFGTGLVKTVEDLGVQSEAPAHGALLDWLAVEFRERGWSMKHLHRLIVTSATYRQSSKVSRELVQMDPENRLLARGARFRMPSMILRDVALGASGLLDNRVGGAPVYPYQPDQIWESLAITKERDFTYPTSSGKDLYRRSLYTFWRRTVGPANMFDAANRQVCKVRQNITNTPLHALTTLNDPTWAEAARVLAARSMEAAKKRDERLSYAYRRVLGRSPTDRDRAMLGKAFDKQLAIYQADPAAAAEVVAIGSAPKNEKLDPVEHAAFTAVCLILLNLDEALTRE